MNLREIVQRPKNLPFDNDEMVFVVENYIKDKTNKKVDINILKNLHNIQRFAFEPIQECTKLMSAFCVAQNYYLS